MYCSFFNYNAARNFSTFGSWQLITGIRLQVDSCKFIKDIESFMNFIIHSTKSNFNEQVC